MFAVLLKDLRIYTNSRRYRLVQLTVLCCLVLCFFLSTLEFYAQGIEEQSSGMFFDVGRYVYSVLTVCIYITQLLIPKHAIESINIERRSYLSKSNVDRNLDNAALLVLIPIPFWKMILGKISAVIIWWFFGVFLTLPLFTLSLYMGGLCISQLMKSGFILIVNSLIVALVGIMSALWNHPKRAASISYGIILTINILPLLPISPIDRFPLLDLLSPLHALLTVLSSGG